MKRYLSFFSGALGLDLGLEAAGLHPLAYNEFDSAACETIRANRPGVKLFDCDIRTLSPRQLERELRISPGELFAIVGGPPCQAFSTAGRRLGLNDERGNVFLHFINLIVSLKPKYAIFENVRGLLSAPLNHRPHSERGNAPLSSEEKPGGALLHILRALESAGFSTTFTLYDTANYGVPQNRERLIFIASRDGKGVPFVPPSHSDKGLGNLDKWATVADALATVKTATHSFRPFNEKRSRYLAMLQEGQNWRHLPKRMQRAAMGQSWFANGGKTGFYRRLALNRPSPTLVTRPTMPATLLCHPTELRPLSVQEYAAIQTFPEGYVFKGSIDDQYRQIGNAVPPLFGEAVGRHLVKFDEGEVVSSSIPVRFSRYLGTDHVSWRAAVEDNEPALLF